MRMSLTSFLLAILALTPHPANARQQQSETMSLTVRSDGTVTAIEGIRPSAFAAVAQAAPITDITMRPSVTTTNLGKSTSQLTLVFICADSTGQPVNCEIALSHQSVAFSGGHDHHDDNRPKGSLSATNGMTGTAGFATLYTAPEVGGVVSLAVSLLFPPVPPATVGQTVAFTRSIGITVPELLALPPGNY